MTTNPRRKAVETMIMILKKSFIERRGLRRMPTRKRSLKTMRKMIKKKTMKTKPMRNFLPKTSELPSMARSEL
ncbi:hypothetical protein D3C83_147220 [compost metagenome]